MITETDLIIKKHNEDRKKLEIKRVESEIKQCQACINAYENKIIELTDELFKLNYGDNYLGGYYG